MTPTAPFAPVAQPDWPGSLSYCITAMPEYAHTSFEELRYAHYKPGEEGVRHLSSLIYNMTD
jgi:hypothetical protein